jgi:hypothetical protein
MERDLHRRHIPFCETRPAIVDQYMWPEKDTTERVCNNGVTHPIYACNGVISRTLPLTSYPRVDEVHPQIRMSSQPHFGSRDPRMRRAIEEAQLDIASRRLEGLYVTSTDIDPNDRLYR